MVRRGETQLNQQLEELLIFYSPPGLRCYKCPQPGKGVSFEDNMKCTEPGAGIGTPQECRNSDNNTMCVTRITEGEKNARISK